MLKLLKYMKNRERWMVLGCIALIVGQIYFDLTMPDYMSDLTVLINTPGSEMADILTVGSKMLGCTLASAALAIACGFLTSRIAAGYSFAVREKLFSHVMLLGKAETSKFSIPSLITRTTNDITQLQMIVVMGLQSLVKAPIMAVWAIIKILGKSWELSAVTASAVVVICTTVLAIMSVCLPRFRKVQKLTDTQNRMARENLTGINVVHAFNAEGYQTEKFDVPNTEMMNTQLKNQRLFSLMQPVMGTCMNGLSLAIYWLGAALINQSCAATKSSFKAFSGNTERDFSHLVKQIEINKENTLKNQYQEKDTLFDDVDEPMLPSALAAMPNGVMNALYHQTMKIMGRMVDYKELRMIYACAIKEIKTKFEILNTEFNLQYHRNPINSIQTRLKSTASIIEKLVKLNKSIDIDSVSENIHDT